MPNSAAPLRIILIFHRPNAGCQILRQGLLRIQAFPVSRAYTQKAGSDGRTGATPTTGLELHNKFRQV